VHDTAVAVVSTPARRRPPEGDDLEGDERLASRDIWRCDVQVWEVLGQPRGGSAIRLLRAGLIVEDADRCRAVAGLQEVVGLEAVDASDEFPNLVLVLGELSAKSGLPAYVRTLACIVARLLTRAYDPREWESRIVDLRRHVAPRSVFVSTGEVGTQRASPRRKDAL
jgi:hypothetical protein